MQDALYPEMAVQIVNKAKGRNTHLPIHWQKTGRDIFRDSVYKFSTLEEELQKEGAKVQRNTMKILPPRKLPPYTNQMRKA